MSTNIPPKVQDASTPKEQTASKEMSMGKEQISKAQDAASEIKHDMVGSEQSIKQQTVGKGMDMGKEQISKAQDAASEIKQDMVSSAQSVRDLVKELAQVTTQGSEEILKMQSEACVESISESINGLAPSVASTSPVSLLWDLPHQYKTHSERMVKALFSYWSVMARIQQQQLELLGPTLHRNIENTTHTITQLNLALANRRGPSTVLNFSERRKAASMAQQSSRAHAQEFAGAEAEQGYGGSQRASRQAAG